MPSFSLVLAALARCERPSGASWRFWICQPGRFAQGPDEKYGRAGRARGAVTDGAFRAEKASRWKAVTGSPRGKPKIRLLLPGLLRAIYLPFCFAAPFCHSRLRALHKIVPKHRRKGSAPLGGDGAHDFRHFQIVLKASEKTESSASIAANLTH